MRLLNNLFRRKVMKDPVRTLRIDGVKAPEMTPKPDDAELAAQALLEHESQPKKAGEKKTKAKQPKEGTTEYYQQMSGKINDAHAAEARAAQRYISFVEDEIKQNPGKEQLEEIERGLYGLQDAAEREKGELLSRWQHCIAECILLQQTELNNDKTED